MLSNLIEDWARGIARKFGRIVAKSGLSPNALTVLGFLLNFPAAIVLAQGRYWFLGGVLVLVAGGFDMLDGAVAKVTNRTTTFGAFLDSTLDRYGEVVVFAGLLFFYRSGANTDQYNGSVLVYIAIAGSLMVSYVKARAEGLNIECKGVGLLPRPERVILVALGCMLNTWVDWALIAALWLLAIGTNFTAIQRIAHIWLEAKRQQDTALAASLSVSQAVPELVETKEASKEPVIKEMGEEKVEEESLMRRGYLFRRAGGR